MMMYKSVNFVLAGSVCTTHSISSTFLLRWVLLDRWLVEETKKVPKKVNLVPLLKAFFWAWKSKKLAETSPRFFVLEKRTKLSRNYNEMLPITIMDWMTAKTWNLVLIFPGLGIDIPEVSYNETWHPHTDTWH